MIIAFIFHMFLIMPSGSNYCIKDTCGLYLWGVHAHDSIWHIALITTAFKQIPFVVPTYSGAILSGYNILLDLFVYLLTKVGISPFFSFFKLLPLLWFVLFGVGAITLGRKIKDDVLFVAILLILLFFGGSYSYFLTLYHNGTIDRSASVLAMQSGLMMTNVQLALSFTVILFMLYFIKIGKFNFKQVILFSILTFIAIGLKFYGAVIAIFLAGAYILEIFIQTKKISLTFKYCLPIIFSIIISVLFFYNPLAALKSGSVLIYSPFALVHSMIEERDLMYLKDLVLQRYYLLSVNPLSPRLLAIELFTALLFIFINLGSRFFGLIYFFYKLIRRQVTRFDIYVAISILIGTLLAILFIQKGIWWNTVQFFYYVIFLANFFAAQLIYKLLKTGNRILYLAGILLVLLALPINLDIIKGTLTAPRASVNRQELAALEFLKKQPEGAIFSSFHYADKKNSGSFDETAYVPAFTEKQSYIDNLHVLKLIGIDYSARLDRVQNMDCKIFQEVKYIYFKKYFSNQFLKKCKSELKDYKKIFENNKVTIFGKV